MPLASVFNCLYFDYGFAEPPPPPPPDYLASTFTYHSVVSSWQNAIVNFADSGFIYNAFLTSSQVRAVVDMKPPGLYRSSLKTGTFPTASSSNSFLSLTDGFTIYFDGLNLLTSVSTSITPLIATNRESTSNLKFGVIRPSGTNNIVCAVEKADSTGAITLITGSVVLTQIGSTKSTEQDLDFELSVSYADPANAFIDVHFDGSFIETLPLGSFTHSDNINPDDISKSLGTKSIILSYIPPDQVATYYTNGVRNPFKTEFLDLFAYRNLGFINPNIPEEGLGYEVAARASSVVFTNPAVAKVPTITPTNTNLPLVIVSDESTYPKNPKSLSFDGISQAFAYENSDLGTANYHIVFKRGDESREEVLFEFGSASTSLRRRVELLGSVMRYWFSQNSATDYDLTSNYNPGDWNEINFTGSSNTIIMNGTSVSGTVFNPSFLLTSSSVSNFVLGSEITPSSRDSFLGEIKHFESIPEDTQFTNQIFWSSGASSLDVRNTMRSFFIRGFEGSLASVDPTNPLLERNGGQGFTI